MSKMRQPRIWLFWVFAAILLGSIFYFEREIRSLSGNVGQLKLEVVALRKSISELQLDLKKVRRQQPPLERTAWGSIDDDAVLGKEDAPVTMIEFSEFQCPFCARFATQTLPKIRTDYIDTGKLRLVFRDYPLSFHKFAAKAAEAAECAGDQGMYWEMNELLFQNNKHLQFEDLKQYGEKLGLYMPDYIYCLESGKNAAEVRKDILDGRKAGVNSTPSFVIGVTRPDGKIHGAFLKGARPFEVFRKVIDAKLAEAARK